MQTLFQMWVSFYGPKQRIRLSQQGVQMDGGCVSKVCLQGYWGGGVGGCWELKRLNYRGGLRSCLGSLSFFFKFPALLLCVSVRVQGLCINFCRGQKGHWGF